MDTFQKYLVELSGELLLVERIRAGELFFDGNDTRRYYTVHFNVSKMESRGDGEENNLPFRWSRVETLGDNALFLSSSSRSVSVKDYNDCVKENCIYFTDDNPELYMGEPGGAGRDMGIYDMETETIEPHFMGESLCHLALAPPTTWII